MRVPTRKADKYLLPKGDGLMTAARYQELSAELEKLTKIIRPRLAEDVKKAASDGDFSENAAYQIAKGRLRGINQRITDIEELLKKAEIIQPSKNSYVVSLGNQVTVESTGKTKTYTILGSEESDPAKGIISKNSPLGSALLGKNVGQKATIKLKDKTVEYKIVKIE
jgi:transcription elongation factor GreA